MIFGAACDPGAKSGFRIQAVHDLTGLNPLAFPDSSILEKAENGEKYCRLYQVGYSQSTEISATS